jgi:phosphate transport system substrate-binding protein
MKRITSLLILAAMLTALLTSCNTGDASVGNNEGGRVMIIGSTSVSPYIEVIAENYKGGIVDVMGGGSGRGIQAATANEVEIGMSSRALKDEEKEQLEGRYFDIAKDGLALIVHRENPVKDLTLEEIRSIYTREITNWNQLTCPDGKPGPDRKIHVVSREEGSGTRGAFEELVMDGEMIHLRTIVLNTNGGIRQFVAGNRNAIGFVSLGLAQEQDENTRNRLEPVQGVSIAGVEPTFERLFDGTYLLYRPFVFITGSELTNLPQGVQGFLKYLLSEEGQTELTNRGLVPVKDPKLVAVLGE